MALPCVRGFYRRYTGGRMNPTSLQSISPPTFCFILNPYYIPPPPPPPHLSLAFTFNSLLNGDQTPYSNQQLPLFNPYTLRPTFSLLSRLSSLALCGVGLCTGFTGAIPLGVFPQPEQNFPPSYPFLLFYILRNIGHLPFLYYPDSVA